MAQIETWYNQDLQQAVKVHYIDGNVFSADNNGNIVGVNVFDGGEPATLSGTVSASIIRADGATVAATGTLSGNQVSVALPQSAYAVPGAISIVVKLTNGTETTTMLAVVGNVYQSATDTVVDPGTIIPDISALIAEIEAAVATIPQDYSSLSLDVEDIKAAVISTSETTVSSTGSVTGSIETDGTINSGYNTFSVYTFPVEPNKLYRFVGQFVWTMVGIAFYDGNGDFIEYKEHNNTPSSTTTFFNATHRTPYNCATAKVSKFGSYACSVSLVSYANNLEDDVNAINAAIGSATLKTKSATLKAGINEVWDAVDCVADELTFNDYLQGLFALFRWNDTYGYTANQTAMSVIAAQKYPFDVKLTNLHYPTFMNAVVRTFSSITATPANLVDTISYSMYGEGAVSSIVLPKNTYWTVQLTRPNNVDIDLATYKYIPHFVAGENINFASQLGLNNTLVVGKAMAPYTKIQDAVDAATAGDTILILPGTYEEDVSAWGKEVHLVGIDRDSTIIIEKTGLYSKPPLEINVGSVRNITLIETGEGSSWGDDGGKGRAYTVHIENGDGYTGVGELWFDNCKLINYKHAAVGCGLYQDLHVHFNNCYMYSGRASDVLDDYYRGTFYYHTCVAENITGQMMTVKDCEIINEDTACFFGGVTPNATSATCRSTFINNNFYALAALAQNTNDLAIVYNILNFHDCKLTGNSRGNNIPVLNAP